MPESVDGVDFLELDPNMRLSEHNEADLQWLLPCVSPFRVSGFAWLLEEGKYRRLPVSPLFPIRDAVDELANCTAGGQIHFQTNSSKLSIRIELSGPANFYHMPATGQCGFDCYIGQFGQQVYFSTTHFDHTQSNYECILFESLDRQMRNIVLNFPLYQGVKEISIGLDQDAEVIASPPYHSDKRIIVYGTSITQGGCASRPGMSYTNILSRRFPYEFINLGFSGNGKGEPELAHIIASIDNPGLLVLDYEANVTIDEYKTTLAEFIRIFREHHPNVPILVVSKIQYSVEHINKEAMRNRLELKSLAEKTVKQLRENGDMNITFMEGDNLLGEHDLFECTVDGIHPTDLGFLRMADGLTPILTQLIRN